MKKVHQKTLKLEMDLAVDQENNGGAQKLH